MISCTQGMLLFLDRYHRTAYILGEIFEVTREQGGYILDISSAAFRKRLSRARDRLNDFMQHHCGLVNPDNPCLCTRQITDKTEAGQVEKSRLVFTGYPCRARKDPVVMKRVSTTVHRAKNMPLQSFRISFPFPPTPGPPWKRSEMAGPVEEREK